MQQNNYVLKIFRKQWGVLGLVAILFSCSNGIAQQIPYPYSTSGHMSYISVWDAVKPFSDDTSLSSNLNTIREARQTTTYVDGLGRTIQTVIKGASPSGFDMVTTNIYDAVGKESVKYFGFPANNTGSNLAVSDGLFKMNPFQEMAAFYSTFNASGPLYEQGEYFYYTQINYEASPLNRTLTTYSPGNSWVGSGRGVTQQYLVAMAGDSVRKWNIADTVRSNPVSTGMYGDGKLYKNIVTDEQGHQTIEYKNNEGQLILKKAQLWNSPAAGHSGWLCTYYVYDSVDNLRFVMQPKAVEWLQANGWNFANSGGSQVTAEFCFRYEYDARKHLIIKKVPGADEEWMIYDSRDRLVLNQNAILRGQSKWLFTKYDALNRPIVTGFYLDGTHNTQVSMQAYLNTQNMAMFENYQTATFPLYSLNQSFPVVAFSDVQTIAYYDDYSWGGWYGAYGSKDNSYDNRFSTTYSSYPYPQPLTQSTLTTGMKTGGWDATGLLTGTYYDDHGRPIQTKQYNWTGGMDITTTQYDFSGKPLQSYLRHQKMGNNAQTHYINTRLSYDQAGRLKSVYKNIDSAATDQLIDSMQYDELGQLKAKYLGNGLDNLTYDYNVRGWLMEVNKKYLTGAENHYFGMELAYDKPTAAIGTTSYANSFLNGNISGMIWKSAGDGIGRKYDFLYDNVNRLTAANFLQNTSGSSWDNSSINYTVNNLGYDANGNILGMKQYGFKLGGSSPIDQLRYKYQLNSNKLSMVYDTANDQNSKLGDFHYNPTTKDTVMDYAYDNNGNLQSDKNKSITSITYNYLNLPLQIQINGKGSIQYWYDAAGNKLQKQVVDTTVSPQKVIKTIYVGGMVYQNDTIQFLSHEEGRARWAFHKYTNGTTGYKWEYDFFEKDHLGNTRVVLSQQKDTAKYMATMEGVYRNTENSLFYNIPATVYARTATGGYPVNDGTSIQNDSVSRVNGSGQKVGPAIILKVMSGDSVVIGTNYYFNSTSATNGQQLSASDLINALASGIVSATGGAHGSFSDLTGSSTPLTGALTSFITTNNANQGGKPNAYLNWILLNNQFGYISANGQSGAQQVATAGTTAGGGLQAPLGTTFKVKTSGYLYIYVSNATPNWDVFFDNLSIMHYAGPMLEETHYYPFGLTMAGISDKAVKSQYAENKYRYNKGSELQNKEFSDGSGLEMYETPLRELDPQLGRWWQLDSKPGYAENPYSAMGNNPILHNDPLGDVPGDFYNEQGQHIGSDGKNDNKNYVIRTTTTTTQLYGSDNYSEKGKSNPISKADAAKTEDLIKHGNFGSYVMNNVVEIEPTKSMSLMKAEVSKDNSKGGTSPSNNREYGGLLFNHGVVPEKPGPVGDPSKPFNASITSVVDLTFHSHPSGTKTVNLPGGGTGIASWTQPPSRTDMTGITTTQYVFGMATKQIYIYNNTGILAIVPQSTFK